MSANILAGKWRQHPVHTDYYFSDLGEVVSKKNGKYRKLVGTACGQQKYKAIAVKGAKKIYIHRTVCELFNGPPKEKEECRHLDGDKTNNCAANLKWGTSKENAKDKILHGTNGEKEKNPMAKLTMQQVSDMREIRGKEKATYKDIAKKFNVSTMTAYRAINKESWK